MRHHPLYFAACVLFAIAIEFVILRRIRQHRVRANEPDDEPSSQAK